MIFDRCFGTPELLSNLGRRKALNDEFLLEENFILMLGRLEKVNEINRVGAGGKVLAISQQGPTIHS